MKMMWYEISFLVGGSLIAFGIILAGAGWIGMQQRSWDRLKQIESERTESPPRVPRS